MLKRNRLAKNYEMFAPRAVAMARESHVGEQGEVICRICGRSELFESRLIMHLVKHTREKPFPCDTCGQKFARHSNLKVHCLRSGHTLSVEDN